MKRDGANEADLIGFFQWMFLELTSRKPVVLLLLISALGLAFWIAKRATKHKESKCLTSDGHHGAILATDTGNVILKSGVVEIQRPVAPNQVAVLSTAAPHGRQIDAGILEHANSAASIPLVSSDVQCKRDPQVPYVNGKGSSQSQSRINDTQRRSTRKKTKKIVDPAHYRRHSGVPGHLYLARNPLFQVGLYKLGYATVSPETRMTTLNYQHSIASDIGSFELLHSVPVSASYEAETALFELISEARVFRGREFFFERQDYLIRGMEAARQFGGDTTTSFDDFHEWSLERDPWEKFRPKTEQSIDVPELRTASGGWLYAARNPWHRDDIYRVSHTVTDPNVTVEKLNAVQRTLTSQIGFFVLVLCKPIDDIDVAWKSVRQAIALQLVPGSRSYFNIPLSDLRTLFESMEMMHGQATTVVEKPVLKTVGSQLSMAEVSGRPPRDWAAWTSPCPGCGTLLRVTGAIGASEVLDCPACGQSNLCQQGARRCTINSV